MMNSAFCDADTCSSYECVTNLTDGNCGTEAKTTQDVFAYKIQFCADQTKQTCPVNSLNPDTTTSVKCVDVKTPETFKSYPGGPCKVDTDCKGSLGCDATSGKCKGKANGEECTTNGECLIGSACIRNADNKLTCTAQVEDGKACSTDYDCKNTSGCLGSVCTPYFSKDDGADATDPTVAELSFCKNGATKEGKCYSRKLTSDRTTPCNSTTACKYSDNTSTADDCQCSKSKDGKKFCKLGNGDQENLDYISQLKGLLSVNTCHTLERGLECSDIYNNQNAKYTQVKSARTVYQNFAQMTGIDTCIQTYFYPDFQKKVVTKQCPVYKCNKDLKDNCAVVVGKDDGSKSVDLNECTADKDKSYCQISEVEVFASNDYKATCKAPPAAETSARFPGEACDDQNLCSTPGSECKDKKCTTPTGDCTSTSQCPVGQACTIDTTDLKLKCISQLSEGSSPCKSDFDCKNGLGCYWPPQDGTQVVLPKCIKYFSLEVGTDVTTSSVLNDNVARLCNLGITAVDKDGKIKCDQLKSVTTPDSKTGLVACNYSKGDTCQYKSEISGATGVNECQCGYDDKGTSYCPRTHEDKNAWTAYYSQVRNTYSNSCHSFSRFACYLNDKSKLSSVAKEYRNTFAYNKFYGAQDCVVRMLGSSSYLFSSLLVVASLIAFIF
jgi:hypothetical protein